MEPSAANPAAVAWRNAAQEELHWFDEPDFPAQPHTLSIPNMILREASSVASVSAFMAIGEAWAQMVAHYLPPRPRVADIGCGCGKLARFFYFIPGLTYVGVDLYAPGIRWCNRTFAPHKDRFEFIHFDGHSEVYNPGGSIKACDYVLPMKDGEIDMTVCASLFTHLYEADARHYLKEIARVTKAGGQAIISIHVEHPEGQNYSGDEARIDIDPVYFSQMCDEADLPVEEEVGVVYGQTVFRLRRRSSPESEVAGLRS